jgi:hypothetical protein
VPRRRSHQHYGHAKLGSEWRWANSWELGSIGGPGGAEQRSLQYLVVVGQYKQNNRPPPDLGMPPCSDGGLFVERMDEQFSMADLESPCQFMIGYKVSKARKFRVRAMLRWVRNIRHRLLMMSVPPFMVRLVHPNLQCNKRMIMRGRGQCKKRMIIRWRVQCNPTKWGLSWASKREKRIWSQEGEFIKRTSLRN